VTATDADDLTAPTREALAALDKGISAPTREALSLADVAERTLVQVRDGLIERHREDGPSAGWREPLEKVNVALSLVAGVDYPAQKVKRKPLEQARDLLHLLLAVFEERR
jgi:hypothetical protein